MSTPNSPCAACKLLRRKCTQECVFAPYFPPDQPQKFANVHKVFGASNVTKLLNELHASQREDAVNSLAYEADARLQDPVYGCVGIISVLQFRLKELQNDLNNARKELATYMGPQAMIPNLQPPAAAAAFMTTTPHQHPHMVAAAHLNNMSSSSHRHVMPHMLPMMGIPTAGPSRAAGQLVIRDAQQHHQQQYPHHHHQLSLDAQQHMVVAAAAVREPQEMFGTYEQQPHQQQQELVRFNEGYEAVGSVTAAGFNQIRGGGGGAALSPSLTLSSFDNAFQIQPQQPSHEHHHQHELEAQLLLQPENLEPQSTQQQQPRAGSEDGKSTV